MSTRFFTFGRAGSKGLTPKEQGAGFVQGRCCVFEAGLQF